MRSIVEKFKAALQFIILLRWNGKESAHEKPFKGLFLEWRNINSWKIYTKNLFSILWSCFKFSGVSHLIFRMGTLVAELLALKQFTEHTFDNFVLTCFFLSCFVINFILSRLFWCETFSISTLNRFASLLSDRVLFS